MGKKVINNIKSEVYMKRLITILVLFTGLNVFAEDMSKYLMDTQKMAQEGKNEEALKRFIWLYDHSLEHEPAFHAVRTSYLLSYWKELGNKYPPALKALQEIRDKETELIKNGKGTFDTFQEVTSINEQLMEIEKSIELFEFMDKKYPALAKRYWPLIDSKIIAAKKFDLARKYIPDFMKKFNKSVLSYKENILRYETTGDLKNYKEYNENSFIGETLDLIAVAEAIKDRKAAEQIRAKAFGILPDSRLK
ncbi:MAG: hypothetical protein ACYC4Q_05240 [Victivallaceae bacterium]